MSDVVERLRKHVFYGDARLLNFKRHSPLAMEAADEIERLRSLLEEARALGCPVYAHHDLCTRIDAALKGNQ